MKNYAFAFVLLLAAVTAASTAIGQTPSAGVMGRVTDQSGAVIPGAIIKVTNLDTNISQQTATNESGDFVVPYLNPASHALEAQAAGFRTYKRDNFTLAVSQILRMDIRLEVGAATETVTITDALSALRRIRSELS